MSRARTVSHAALGECIKYLEGQILNRDQRISILVGMNRELEMIVSKSTFVDDRAPLCGICDGKMDVALDFASCVTCGRVYERRVMWLTVATLDE